MTTLRLLVACPRCKQQFDASGRPVGSRFHCTCGELLAVPAPQAQDAAVVRCSSCGAPRQGRSSHCVFCSADFTLHERDLDTLCPRCMTRISRKARFCHSCATPLAVQGRAGEGTDFPCPCCGEERKLASRRIDGRSFAALECGSCGGLFIGNEAFRHLAEEARREQVSHREHRDGASGPPRYLATAPPPQEGAFYRMCPQCRKMMVRQNYGRSSGVIIDLCKAHGAWFDVQELDRILAWIRAGGLTAEHERRAQELNVAERERRLRDQRDVEMYFPETRATARGRLFTGLFEVAASLFD